MAGESDAADPTELAGIAEMRTESVQAWSLDEADEDYPLTGSWEDPERRLTPRRITILGVAASLVAVAAVGGVAAWKLRQGPDVHTTTVVVATATATATVVERATPSTPIEPVLPTASAPTSTAAEDQQLLANLRRQGWRIDSPAQMTGQAHVICMAMHTGASPDSVAHMLSPPGDGNSFSGALLFVHTAMSIYPDCP